MQQILKLAAVAVAVAGAGIVATTSAQGPGVRTLTVFEDVAHESSSLVDNAPRSRASDPDNSRFRLSAGDEIVTRTPLLSRAGGARLGTSHAHAVVVSGTRFERATLQGAVVLALRDGTIVLSGLVGATPRPLAVVGGTGAYEGARGSATEKEGSGGAELAIRLLAS
jgi:hypothetical protein